MRKLLVVVLIALVITACGGATPGPMAAPLPAAPAAQVSAPASLETPQLGPVQKISPVPEPVPTARMIPWPATPPVSRWQPKPGVTVEFWRMPQPNEVMAVVLPVVAAEAALDGPAPVGDVVAIVTLTTAVGYQYIYFVMQGKPAAATEVMSGTLAEITQWIIGTPAQTLSPSELLKEQWVTWSMKHAESKMIRDGILANSRDRQIRSRGDGSSNGSVELWAGIDRVKTEAIIGGYAVFSNQAAYFALRVPVVVDAVGACTITVNGCRPLGNSGYWYKPNDLVWVAAWWVTRSIGHGEQAEANFLPVPEARLKWEACKALYGLTIPVMVLYY